MRVCLTKGIGQRGHLEGFDKGRGRIQIGKGTEPKESPFRQTQFGEFLPRQIAGRQGKHAQTGGLESPIRFHEGSHAPALQTQGGTDGRQGKETGNEENESNNGHFAFNDEVQVNGSRCCWKLFQGSSRRGMNLDRLNIGWQFRQGALKQRNNSKCRIFFFFCIFVWRDLLVGVFHNMMIHIGEGEYKFLLPMMGMRMRPMFDILWRNGQEKGFFGHWMLLRCTSFSIMFVLFRKEQRRLFLICRISTVIMYFSWV